MRDITEKYGLNAGKLWNTLQKYGPLTETTLLKSTRLSEEDFYAAIGWLARENKIRKKGNKFELKDTNLTPTVGKNAGKVWNTLNNQCDVDISSISKISKIKQTDAYAALGWLAREDKIRLSKNKTKTQPEKFSLK